MHFISHRYLSSQPNNVTPLHRYITVGCGAMKLILKNFGSVIKTNIDSPVTMGVDISREER